MVSIGLAGAHVQPVLEKFFEPEPVVASGERCRARAHGKGVSDRERRIAPADREGAAACCAVLEKTDGPVAQLARAHP